MAASKHASKTLTAEQRSLRASLAAYTGWAKCEDRAARSRHGFDGLMKKFADEIDPQRRLPADELAKRCHDALMAHLQRIKFEASKRRGAKT